MSQYLPPLPRKPITRVSEIYVDESSHTKHRYLVLGGLIATPDRARNLEAAFARARLPELPAGELKWTKVSATKLPAYERVIREFFAASKSPDGPHFHALVVDTTRINDRRFNQGSRELGFNKEVHATRSNRPRHGRHRKGMEPKVSRGVPCVSRPLRPE
jgi:hypothetical protein